MSSTFTLEQSRWYSLMKMGLACRSANACAAEIKKWSDNLAKLEYEPTAGSALAEAEDNLRAALDAVEIARAEYERSTQSTLIAAE